MHLVLYRLENTIETENKPIPQNWKSTSRETPPRRMSMHGQVSYNLGINRPRSDNDALIYDRKASNPTGSRFASVSLTVNFRLV